MSESSIRFPVGRYRSSAASRFSRVAAVFFLLAAVLALAAARPGPARAGSTYCTTQGTRTYCDDGRAYYRYGNDIVSNDGRRWHDFGKHVYGPGDDWIAKHGRDSYTTHLDSGRPDENAILPRILDRDEDAKDGDGDGDGDGGDD